MATPLPTPPSPSELSRPKAKPAPRKTPSTNALLADTLVFPGESEERFCDLLAVLEQELQPEPGIETDLVRLIAVRLWSAGKPQYLNRAPRNTVRLQMWPLRAFDVYDYARLTATNLWH